MLEKAVDIVVGFLMVLLNIAAWLLAGSWYQVMFALLGVIGSLFLIRQIHLELSDFFNSDGFGCSLTAIILLVATLFWLLLAAAIAWVAFFS